MYAHDAESAVEKFAETHDCENEYGILQQGECCEQVIEARDSAGEITRWNILGESVPHYSASPVE